MIFRELRKRIIDYPLFTFNDILKWFPDVNPKTLEVQIHQWKKRGEIEKIKKGLYWFKEKEIEDKFYLVEKLYFPSYVSLESALNYYGIIPDIPQMVTSVTPLITRKYKTPFGTFLFRHLKKDYFFGFRTVKSKKEKNFFYNIATPEKALLDFLYFNLKRFTQEKSFKEERFSFDKDFHWPLFLKMADSFNNKTIKELALSLEKEYG